MGVTNYLLTGMILQVGSMGRTVYWPTGLHLLDCYGINVGKLPVPWIRHGYYSPSISTVTVTCFASDASPMHPVAETYGT